MARKRIRSTERRKRQLCLPLAFFVCGKTEMNIACGTTLSDLTWKLPSLTASGFSPLQVLRYFSPIFETIRSRVLRQVFWALSTHPKFIYLYSLSQVIHNWKVRIGNLESSVLSQSYDRQEHVWLITRWHPLVVKSYASDTVDNLPLSCPIVYYPVIVGSLTLVCEKGLLKMCYSIHGNSSQP